ncbi:LuxR C-terminal-related transcriptional regulator [Streptomyces sp. NPDC088789]|uniref:LuxR family transcriptional regulator AbsR2 n=1 Tax=Streptomyces sp. NPDC088789 TaxID=3365899 RepID=UPI0037F559D7
MTTHGRYERDARTLELPWPFTGREDELELVRRSLAAGRHGIVVTGPAGCGKTRLAAEALRGTDCARVAGAPGTHRIPFAAFAHLLPEPVSLHRAVHLLSGVRLLLVDDAHLLDDASAALVHHLAVHGPTRLVVVARDSGPLPGAVSRLWTGELLPRLALEPLPDEDTAQLLTAGTAGSLDPLTMNRLRRLCEGDLRLLRDLSAAIGEQGLLARVPGTDTRAWRGPVPLTETVRLRTAPVLGRVRPEERETLDRLAFAEPLAPHLDAFDLPTLERLESDGLVRIDAAGTVHLARPLYGPVLRAAAGTLRARRLSRTPDDCTPALKSEAAALEDRIEEGDVSALAAPVGRWLVEEGGTVPPEYAAVRARYARLRGALRESAAWAREGLRTAPDDPACATELAMSTAQSGDLEDPGTTEPPLAAAHRAVTSGPAPDTRTSRADEPGPMTRRAPRATVEEVYDAVRVGAPERALGLLPPGSLFAQHAEALARGDGPALDRVAAVLEARGYLLFAAEAFAQAVTAHRDPSAARTSRTRAITLARRCQGARTPALSGLALGELTARQRQIVTLAAAGLSNRQIAERLTLSVRTVGNHLYSAYTRLGASDRGDLPCLIELPATCSA